MKTVKRTLGLFLALLLLASFPVSALAAEYNIAEGTVEIEAYEDGQRVWQYNVTDEYVNDDAPVIIGSSEENSVYIYSDDGAEATVTLNNVTASGLYVGTSDGSSAVITVEGTNTFNDDTYFSGDDEDKGTVTLQGSGELVLNDSWDGWDVYATDIIVDGPSIEASGPYNGINLNNSNLTVESGSLTGTGPAAGIALSGGEWEYDEETGDFFWTPDPTIALTVNGGTVTGTATGVDSGLYDSLSSEEPEEYYMDTAGIAISGTLAVNGGTVTGVTNGDERAEICAGIYMEKGSTLTIGDNMQVLDADGNDITAEATADPTILNEMKKTVIQELAPAEAKRMIAGTNVQEITATVKNAAGESVNAKVLVAFFSNYSFKINIQTDTQEIIIDGWFTLRDGELIFILSDSTEIKLTADNELIVPLPSGGKVELKLDEATIKALLMNF